MKIRTKITLPIILTAVLVLTAASLYSYFFTDRILEEEVVKHLEITAQLAERHIETILLNQKEKIEIAATHGELSQAELQTIIDISHEFYEVFVINSEGIVINSTDKSRVGLDRSNDLYFVNARNKTYIKPAYFSKDTQKNAIAVSTPHAGGVLVARIELDFFDQIISDRTGLGETGELLLAYQNKEGESIFFSKRRFSEEGYEGHEKEHSVLPIEEALAKNEDIFFDYDYRHVRVIAVTKYIEEVDMGLVVKIDQAEAFAPSRELFIFSIVRILVVLLIFLIITYLIARLISKPIIALHHGTEIVEKGNLDYKVGINTKDEIGQLSRSFDEMTDSLKKSRINTEKKIADRTADLEKINKAMTGRELKMVELKKEIEELKNKKK